MPRRARSAGSTRSGPKSSRCVPLGNQASFAAGTPFASIAAPKARVTTVMKRARR